MENLTITEGIRSKMLSSMKWLQFLTILSCIGVAILLFIALIMFALGNIVEEPRLSGLSGGLLGCIYLIVAAIYIYPIKKCFDLISNTRKAMIEDSQVGLEESANNLHAILKFCGILAIIAICLYFLIFVGAIIVGISVAL